MLLSEDSKSKEEDKKLANAHPLYPRGSFRWAKHLGKQEFSHLLEELKKQIICTQCETTLKDEGSDLDNFIQCNGCPSNIYSCIDCVKSVKKLHSKKNHKFSPAKITILSSRDEDKIIDGRKELKVMANTRIQNKQLKNRQIAYGLAVAAVNSVNKGHISANVSWLQFTKAVSLKGKGKYAPIGCVGLQLLGIGYKWYCKEMEDKEFGRQITKTVVNAEGIVYGSYYGSKYGLKLSSRIVNVNTRNYSGIIVSFIGAIIGSVIVGGTSEYLFEKYWPNKEQQLREKLVKESLMAFGFNLNVTTNRKIFNEKEIRKRYRVRAKEQHPDNVARGGSKEGFQQLNVQFGILLGILDAQQNNLDKDRKISTVIQDVLSITI
eukprot:255990_1